MGTDIHMVVEVREPGGPWRAAPRELAWGNRNYRLFSVLANVRNGTWSEEIQPISGPRGWPKDISATSLAQRDEYKGVLEDWTVLDSEEHHSRSWVTLRELVEYDWARELKMEATVDWHTWIQLKHEGVKPQSFCASSSNQIAEDVAENMLKGGVSRAHMPSVRTTWTISMREAVGHDVFAWLDRLRALPFGMDNVRLAFGFDN